MSRSSKSLARWTFVHKWTSLICTVFMLMLCVTGLPLIFHHEIDHLLHDEVQVAPVAAGTPFASLDAVVSGALAREPGHVPHYLIWDFDEPATMLVSIGKTMADSPADLRGVRVDAYRAAYLEAPDISGRFTNIMLRLHTDMFGGLPGKLFLGLMGFLFCVAVISGIVVYAPSMRKLEFGAYRRERPRVVRWLDLHNLTGILLVAWMLVVGFTGVINTWADLVIKIWQFNELSAITAPYKDSPLPKQPTSVDAALRVALEATPDMRPGFIAFPGSAFSSRAHYLIFMRGNTPLTSRLGRPVLIDATSGAFAGSPEPPWYVKTLLISQPLHFGDYGGLPLRIIWAILDIITIIVLITGLYLWLRRQAPAASVARVSMATQP